MDITPQKLSVIFFGRRSAYSMRVLKAVARAHHVVGVVESQSKLFEPPPRWFKLISRTARKTDLADFARRKNIPYFLMKSKAGAGLEQFIATLKPDVGVIAKMAYLLPDSIIRMFPQGILNSHPSLLPKYRGPLPVFWTYYNQEKQSGVTIHYVDSGEDNGDIVRQVAVPLNLGESARRFEHRCAHAVAREVVIALGQLAAGTIVRTSQRDLPCPFRARMLVKDENPIDWDRWPLDRIFHALCGADGMLQLIPRRPFPWTFLEFMPVGCSATPKSAEAKPTFRREGMSFFIQTRRGVIHLRPRLTAEQLRIGWRRLVRGRRQPQGVPRTA